MLFLTLVACMAAGLGGEETDGITGFEDWNAAEIGAASGDVDAGGGVGDSGELAEAVDLVASWIDGAIHCTHANVASACSAPPQGHGWTIDGTTVNVAFATFTDGDAPCAYTVAYDLTGDFAPGTWTVRANGAVATVVVP
jgi:hypothetical protein